MTEGRSQNTGEAVRHRAFKFRAEARPSDDGPEWRATGRRMAESVGRAIRVG